MTFSIIHLRTYQWTKTRKKEIENHLANSFKSFASFIPLDENEAFGYITNNDSFFPYFIYITTNESTEEKTKYKLHFKRVVFLVNKSIKFNGNDQHCKRTISIKLYNFSILKIPKSKWIKSCSFFASNVFDFINEHMYWNVFFWTFFLVDRRSVVEHVVRSAEVEKQFCKRNE